MLDNQKYSDILNSNINAVASLVATVKGTVGPKGLDVMLVDEFGHTTCTNDGVEILSNLKILHPISRLVNEALKSQEAQVGDGTTSTAILIDALLSSAQNKINNGAKTSRLVKGIQIASEKLINEFRKSSKPIKDINDEKLKQVVSIAARENQIITELIIDAAKKIIDKNKTNILINDSYDLAEAVVATSLSESRVLDGLFIKKKTHFNYSQSFNELSCLIIEGPFEPEPMSSEAISTDEGVKRFENNIQTLLDSAKKISKSGIKAVFTSASMFPTIEEFFVKSGIFVLTHLKKSDIDNLIQASGSQLTTRANLLSSEQNLKDYSGSLEKITYYPELAGFSLIGSKQYQATIIINAETETILEERKRITKDAIQAMIATLKSGYLMGEGIAELNLIKNLQESKQEFKNDTEISAGFDVVIESLAALFKQIVTNAGFEFSELITKLSLSPQNTKGIDLDNGELLDLEEAGVIDPTEVKISAFKIANEVAAQILKINLIVQAK